MDKKTTFTVITLLVIATILFYLSGLHILVHELGHFAPCIIQGGKAEFWTSINDGGATKCLGPEWTEFQKFMFYSGGVLAELILATFLLLCPYISVAGGTMYLLIGYSFFKGAYTTDISFLINEVSPEFSILLVKEIHFCILIIVSSIFLSSLYYSHNYLRNDKRI